ncbi:MAG: class I SAM-dependent methyltransferase [Candidatus Cloacimonetes bacterium]|nr:class I SAM-dependent methyltransferase [Candidatus Cloacimonadota bacterium]
MEYKDRNMAWKEIWNKKGMDIELPPYLADGYDLLTIEKYEKMVSEVIRPLNLKGTEHILECGCGAGAFLLGVLKTHPKIKVAGIDYSPTLLKRARDQINGDFFEADVTDLKFLDVESYDISLSFGVIFYLSSEASALKHLLEMVRVTKYGGQIFIGEVPDASKKHEAENIRRVSHQGVKKISDQNLDHLYLEKGFFIQFANENSLDIKIIDHTKFELGDYQAAKYRYSVYLTKKAAKLI